MSVLYPTVVSVVYEGRTVYTCRLLKKQLANSRITLRLLTPYTLLTPRALLVVACGASRGVVGTCVGSVKLQLDLEVANNETEPRTEQDEVLAPAASGILVLALVVALARVAVLAGVCQRNIAGAVVIRRSWSCGVYLAGCFVKKLHYRIA